MQVIHIITVDLGNESNKFAFFDKKSRNTFVKKLKNKGVFSFNTNVDVMTTSISNKYMKKVDEYLKSIKNYDNK